MNRINTCNQVCVLSDLSVQEAPQFELNILRVTYCVTSFSFRETCVSCFMFVSCFTRVRGKTVTTLNRPNHLLKCIYSLFETIWPTLNFFVRLFRLHFKSDSQTHFAKAAVPCSDDRFSHRLFIIRNRQKMTTYRAEYVYVHINFSVSPASEMLFYATRINCLLGPPCSIALVTASSVHHRE